MTHEATKVRRYAAVEPVGSAETYGQRLFQSRVASGSLVWILLRHRNVR
jgi:hypothetical protein